MVTNNDAERVTEIANELTALKKVAEYIKLPNSNVKISVMATSIDGTPIGAYLNSDYFNASLYGLIVERIETLWNEIKEISENNTPSELGDLPFPPEETEDPEETEFYGESEGLTEDGM